MYLIQSSQQQNYPITVQTPLPEVRQYVTYTFDPITHSRKLRMDVVVWDMYPVLTEEEEETLQNYTEEGMVFNSVVVFQRRFQCRGFPATTK